MSFVDGFSKGFGLVDNAITKQQQLDRQKMLDQRNEQRYQQRMDMQQKQNEFVREKYKDAQNWKAAGFAQQQKQNNWNRDIQEKQLGMQESEYEQNKKLNNIKMKKASLELESAENKLTTQKAQKALKNIYLGQASKEDFNNLSKDAPGFLPQVIKRNDSYNKFANEYLSLSRDYDGALKQAKSPEQKEQIAQKYIQDLNGMLLTKEGRDTLNTAMYESLNARMRNNPDIERISFGGIAPGPNDKYAVKMLIQTKDGETKVAPATKNKTAESSDEVMMVPLETIKGNVEQAITISNQATRYLHENPGVAREMGLKSSKKIKKTITDENTGQMFGLYEDGTTRPLTSRSGEPIRGEVESGNNLKKTITDQQTGEVIGIYDDGSTRPITTQSVEPGRGAPFKEGYRSRVETNPVYGEVKGDREAGERDYLRAYNDYVDKFSSNPMNRNKKPLSFEQYVAQFDKNGGSPVTKDPGAQNDPDDPLGIRDMMR